MGRVYESVVVLLLLSLLVLGMLWLASALTHHNVARESLNGERPSSLSSLSPCVTNCLLSPCAANFLVSFSLSLSEGCVCARVCV